jgi:MFS family permease
LLFARALWGACWSIIRAEGLVTSLATARADRRGRTLAVYHAISRLGAGGGVLLGGLLVDWMGLAPTFLIFAAITAAGALVVPRSPTRESPRNEPPSPPAQAKPNRRTTTILLLTSGLSVLMAQSMVAALTGRLVAERIADPVSPVVGAASLTGILLALREAGNLIAGPVAGTAGDRLGRGMLLTLVCSAQAIAVAFLPVALGPHLLAFLLAFVLFIGSGAYVTIIAVAGDAAPERGRALFMSRFTSSTDLGGALGPIVGYAVYAELGIGWAAAMAAGLFLLAPVLRVVSAVAYR